MRWREGGSKKAIAIPGPVRLENAEAGKTFADRAASAPEKRFTAGGTPPMTPGCEIFPKPG